MNKSNMAWRKKTELRKQRIIALVVCLIMFTVPLVFGLVGKILQDEFEPHSPLSASAVETAHFNVFVPVVLKQTFGLVNGDFEGGATGDQLYWDKYGVLYVGHFTEIQAPTGWTAWWYQGLSCGTGYHSGRPEYNLVDGDYYPSRVYSGKQSARYFTFWRCQAAGLFQEVHLYGSYRLTTVAQVWYSNCSTRPYDPPLDYDCRSSIDAQLYVRIGMDPTGAIDPRSEYVVWSDWIESYGMFTQISTPYVSLAGPTTVFLQSASNWPLKHEDVYWDAVEMDVYWNGVTE